MLCSVDGKINSGSSDAFDMGKDYDAEKITVQSGGTVNGVLLRGKLINYANIVMAPVLVGGVGK